MEKPTHEQTGTNKKKQPVGEKGTRTNWHEDEEKQHEDKEKPEPEETAMRIRRNWQRTRRNWQ